MTLDRDCRCFLKIKSIKVELFVQGVPVLLGRQAGLLLEEGAEVAWVRKIQEV